MKEKIKVCGEKKRKIPSFSDELRREVERWVEDKGYTVEWVSKEAGCWGFGSGAFMPEIDEKEKRIKIVGKINGYKSNKHLQGAEYSIEVSEKGIYLRKEGVGERYSHGQREAWIVGYEDGHFFVQRVPFRIESINEAFEWLKPAEIRKAEKEGRRVERQGDIWLVEMKRKINTQEEVIGRHRITRKNGKTVIEHPQHGVKELCGENWKAIRGRWSTASFD